MSTDTKEKMLSVAEVCELVPGDDQTATWINPGFVGVVRSITKKSKKAGGFFWPCVIADTVGSATIEVSFYQAPKFSEGDQIELSGSGLRRTEYNGKPQAAIGKNTEVHVLGKSVHHEEQVRRAENLQPSVSGQPQHIAPQSVGMAMKAALDISVGHDRAQGRSPDVDSPEFWHRVHKTASAIIRLSRALEHGKLTPSITPAPQKPTAPALAAQTTPPTTQKPAGPPNGQAFPTDGPDEDVPF